MIKVDVGVDPRAAGQDINHTGEARQDNSPAAQDKAATIKGTVRTKCKLSQGKNKLSSLSIILL